MSLKNVTRSDSFKFGQPTWLLLDSDGNPISAFSYFCERNLKLKFLTQKSYAVAVSRFIDYLIEANALGKPVSKGRLNAVIDAYGIFLRDGSKALCERLQESVEKFPEDLWLLKVAQSLPQEPLKPKSVGLALTAVNRFLRCSEALAREAFEKATFAGVVHNDNYVELIESLAGYSKFSQNEIRNLRQNSVLGSVIRFKPQGLTRPRALTSDSSAAIQLDTEILDFPFNRVLDLVNAAACRRDKVLWLLLAASGIRISEALNLRWSDIDIKNQKIFIYDPQGRRFGKDMLPREKIRFKGREYSMTYLINGFRQELFKSLEEYIRHEYVPPQEDVLYNFVFQYVELSRRGQAFIDVSNTSLNSSFRTACTRASIPSPTNGFLERAWTLHSLRHMYGVYMLNYYPVDIKNGVLGLPLADVQVLMGHRSAQATRRYARRKSEALMDKLKASDTELMNSRG